MQKPTFTMQHIGINGKDREEAVQIVTLFASIFDLELRTEKKGSPFAGTCIEAMVGNGPGTHGHIAFYVENMDDAIAYLEDKGVKIAHETAKRNSDGSVYVIYLAEEIGGFAIQLIHN